MKFTRRRAFLWPAVVAGTAAANPDAEGRSQAPNPATPPASEVPARLVNVHDFERCASASMPRASWEFINSGAGDELTVRGNEEAFRRLQLRQRVLGDLSGLNTRMRLLGRERPHPIVLSPTANHGLAHPQADLETLAPGRGDAGARS